MDMRQQQERGRKPSFEEAVDIADEVRQWRRDLRKVIAMRVVAVLLIILAIGIGGFPTFLQYQSAQELQNTSTGPRRRLPAGLTPRPMRRLPRPKHITGGLRLRGSRFLARLKTRSPKCRAARSPVNPVPQNQIAPAPKIRNIKVCSIRAVA